MNDIQKRPTKSEVTVAYMRTASARQGDNSLSLQRQRRACEQHAHQLGLRLGAIYADVGVSGLAEHRPALDQLMLDVARGYVRYVVIADPCRLARNRGLEQRIREHIRSEGAMLAMPCDGRDELTEGRTTCP